MSSWEEAFYFLERLEHDFGVCAAEFLVELFPELHAVLCREFVDGGFVEAVVEVDDEIDVLRNQVFAIRLWAGVRRRGERGGRGSLSEDNRQLSADNRGGPSYYNI